MMKYVWILSCCVSVAYGGERQRLDLKDVAIQGDMIFTDRFDSEIVRAIACGNVEAVVIGVIVVSDYMEYSVTERKVTIRGTVRLTSKNGQELEFWNKNSGTEDGSSRRMKVVIDLNERMIYTPSVTLRADDRSDLE